jgi:hypothetical protein
VIRIGIDVEARTVVTVRAGHVEAAHAERTHIAERHGLNRLVERRRWALLASSMALYWLPHKRNARLAGVAIGSVKGPR